MALSSQQRETARRTRLAERGAGLQWSRKRAQYRTPDGRWIGKQDVRKIIDRDIETTQLRLAATAGEYQAGGLSYELWEARTLTELKRLHIAHAAAAKGGFAQLTQADYGLIGGKLKAQFRYFDGLRREIGRNPAYAESARFKWRVESYAQAARTTYEAVRFNVEVDAGATHARRILHAKESCPGCVGAAGAGWIPVDSMVMIGGYECNVHCRCTIEYKTEA